MPVEGLFVAGVLGIAEKKVRKDLDGEAEVVEGRLVTQGGVRVHEQAPLAPPVRVLGRDAKGGEPHEGGLHLDGRLAPLRKKVLESLVPVWNKKRLLSEGVKPLGGGRGASTGCTQGQLNLVL